MQPLSSPDPLLHEAVSRFTVAALVVASLFAMAPQGTEAQRWLQTAQLEVELKKEGRATVTTFVDTLTSVIERCNSQTTVTLPVYHRHHHHMAEDDPDPTINCDSAAVRRGPDQPDRSLSKIEDRLVEKIGIGIDSPSHVRIEYRFEINNQRYEETITSFQLLFQAGPSSEEIPILYVDVEEPWIQTLIWNGGTPTGLNCGPPHYFSKVVYFASAVREGEIVKIAGVNVRDGFEAKKRKLTRKIERLTYESR